jgi:hypothetical protein
LTAISQDLFSDYSGQNELWLLGDEATVLQILTTLSQPKVKRVILTRDHEMKRFVTQSEVLSLIGDRIAEFGPIVDCTLKECNLGYFRAANECELF